MAEHVEDIGNIGDNRDKRMDLTLMAALFLIGLGLASVGYVRNIQSEGVARVVVVSVAGEQMQSYPLDQDLDLVLSGVNGGSNHLHIAGGQAWLSEASCPDKVCVHMGKISQAGQAIICLPNQVVIEIVAKP